MRALSNMARKNSIRFASPRYGYVGLWLRHCEKWLKGWSADRQWTFSRSSGQKRERMDSKKEGKKVCSCYLVCLTFLAWLWYFGKLDFSTSNFVSGYQINKHVKKPLTLLNLFLLFSYLALLVDFAFLSLLVIPFFRLKSLTFNLIYN